MNFLLWALLILLVIRLLFRWVLPMIMPYLLKRFLKKHGVNFDAFNEPQKKQPPEPPKFNKSKPQPGNDDEYIDFEEVK